MANIYEATVIGGDLVAGDLERGFYGEVPASELFTATELSELLDVTQGKIQFDDTPWLKWAYKGEILFRPKKAFRHSVSWNHLNEKGVVYGDKIIENSAGDRFKIRLMKSIVEGEETAEGNWSNIKNSEWNHLMLPIHVQAKDKTWAYPAYVEDDVPYWSIDYTDKDLHTHYNHGNGTYVWCQERYRTNSNYRVSRGYSGVSYAYDISPNVVNDFVGWAPVLELITPNEILIKKDNHYGYYTDSFQSLGTTYPTKEQFEQYGMSDLSMLEPGDVPVEYEMELVSETDEEKCFSYSFDLNGQHKNMKSIDGIITE